MNLFCLLHRVTSRSRIRHTRLCPAQANFSRSHPHIRTRSSAPEYRCVSHSPALSCPPFNPLARTHARRIPEQRHRAPVPDDPRVHQEDVGRGGHARLLPRAGHEPRARPTRDVRHLRRVREPRVAPPHKRRRESPARRDQRRRRGRGVIGGCGRGPPGSVPRTLGSGVASPPEAGLYGSYGTRPHPPHLHICSRICRISMWLSVRLGSRLGAGAVP